MTTKPPARRPSLFDRLGRGVIQEKLANLRLIRALDVAGIDPAIHRRLQPRLVRLAEHDGLLGSLLELLDRERDNPAEDEGGPIGTFIALGRSVRDDVLGALKGPDRRAVEEALESVAASEPEVWMEVEALRREASSRPRAGPPTLPLGEVEARKLGREMFEEGIPDTEPDARVLRAESKPLPRAHALEPWLRRLPRPWLRGMARLYDLDPSRGKEALALDLARAMRSPDLVERVLFERIGARERDLLVSFLALSPVAWDDLDEDRREGLAVTHDWEAGLPPGVGAKLRAFGLLHVGTMRGTRVVAVQPEAAGLLERILTSRESGLAARLERMRAAVLAAAMDGLPSDDPELDRIAQTDRQLTETFLEWSPGPDPDLAREFLGDVEPPEDPELGFHLMQYQVLDHRRKGSGPTIAEEHLAKGFHGSPEERAVLEAIVAAVPSLWRVVEVRLPQGVLVEDAFRGGGDRLVDDRSLALTTEVGAVLPARLYAAGPFTRLRLAATPVPPGDGADRAVAALGNAFSAHARATGSLDRTAFLRQRPQLVAQAAFRALAHP